MPLVAEHYILIKYAPVFVGQVGHAGVVRRLGDGGVERLWLQRRQLLDVAADLLNQSC